VTAKSTPTDLVSAADLATEELIRARLSAARPHDAIVGEEGDPFEPASPTGLRWVVDPLDGTTNFLFGIPQWAVSIAVEDAEGRASPEWCMTRRGMSCGQPAGTQRRRSTAWRSAAPRAPSSRRPSWPRVRVRRIGARSAGQVVMRLLPEVRDIRRLGSAALDLAWTAAGRYDAYFERGVQLWDIAAGRLICARAGLAVAQLPEAPPHAPAGILVAPPALIGPLEALL
jgi:myo-inositol-1(or 4)-monophosphatase